MYVCVNQSIEYGFIAEHKTEYLSYRTSPTYLVCRPASAQKATLAITFSSFQFTSISVTIDLTVTHIVKYTHCTVEFAYNVNEKKSQVEVHDCEKSMKPHITYCRLDLLNAYTTWYTVFKEFLQLEMSLISCSYGSLCKEWCCNWCYYCEEIITLLFVIRMQKM